MLINVIVVLLLLLLLFEKRKLLISMWCLCANKPLVLFISSDQLLCGVHIMYKDVVWMACEMRNKSKKFSDMQDAGESEP